MSKDFYLDGNYTSKQIDAINNVKGKKASADAKAADGDSASIFDDIKSYKKDKTSGKNKDLFDYIDKTMGMDNLLQMLDADGNGGISENEAKKLADYNKDDDGKLSSKDIDSLVKDVKDVKSAKSTSEVDGKKTETTWELDPTTNKLVKKSDANIETKSVVNEKNNTTTEYEYKDGKKVGAKVYANNDSKTLKSEYTYNENGKPETRKQYIDGRSGVRTERYHTYQYDENGNLKSKKIYKGDSAQGNPIDERFYEDGKIKSRKTYDKNGELKNDYEYRYENGKLTSRYNKANGSTKSYIYDDNGKLTKAEFKDKDGKLTKTLEYNEDGTYKSLTTDDYVTLYDYEKGGIRKSATKYKKEDIENGKPKSDATAVETLSYENGLKTKEEAGDLVKTYTYDDNHKMASYTVKDKDGNVREETKYKDGKVVSREDKVNNTKTEYTYDSDGKKIKEVVTDTKNNKSETINYDPKTGKISYKTDGTYVYVYSYDSDGKETIKKYKASDCTDGKPKDGAEEVK